MSIANDNGDPQPWGMACDCAARDVVLRVKNWPLGANTGAYPAKPGEDRWAYLDRVLKQILRSSIGRRG